MKEKAKNWGKKWTTEEDEQIKKFVRDRVPISEMAIRLNRSHSACSMRCAFYGLKSEYRYSKYKVNKDFWKEFNPINCYYAGIVAADGYIGLYSNRKQKFPYSGSIKLEIHRDDFSTLEDLKKRSNYTGPITFPKNRNTCLLKVHCEEWNRDLIEKFNIVPLKTYRIMPPKDISDQLFFCWLIGYIDGDGCLYLKKNKEDFTIKILSCSEKIIQYIYKYIIDRFPQKLTLKALCTPFKRKNSNCWELRFTGLKAVCLFSYLKQFNVPKLKRKWEKDGLIELENKFKTKYPESFDFKHLPIPV
jgi:hypothetical protein